MQLSYAPKMENVWFASLSLTCTAITSQFLVYCNVDGLLKDAGREHNSNLPICSCSSKISLSLNTVSGQVNKSVQQRKKAESSISQQQHYTATTQA